MKIIKYIFLAVWTLRCFVEIFKNASHYGFDDWIIILIFTLFPYIIIKIVSKKKIIKSSDEKRTDTFEQKENISEPNKTQLTENELSTTYIEEENTIYRVDRKPIADQEIPYLVQLGCEKAVATEPNSENPKFHRTEQEENLSLNFMMKYDSQVDTLTEKFEMAYRNSLMHLI